MPNFYDVEITCTKKLRVRVDDWADGEDPADVADEIAREGFWSVSHRRDGTVEEQDSEMQVETVTPVPAPLAE